MIQFTAHAVHDTDPLVDVHGHFGRSAATGYVSGAPEILAGMEQFGIDMTLVMPQAERDNTAVHAAIADAVSAHPGRILGIVNLDPRLPEPRYRAIAADLLATGSFVAVKLHTAGYTVAPDDEIAEKVFRLAADHGIPAMVHTGLGGPHTLPHRMLTVARRHPDVPVVLCHAGFGAFWAEAVEVALECRNVYLEPSWCPTFAVRHMVRRVGAHRVMFGSDHIDNIGVELAKFAAIGLTAEERRHVLGATATAVFRLAERGLHHSTPPEVHA